MLAAEPPLDTVARETPVAAYRHVQAWSRYDATTRYALVIRRNGTVATAPVTPEPVPFDVDLGLDGRGRLTAV